MEEFRRRKKKKVSIPEDRIPIIPEELWSGRPVMIVIVALRASKKKKRSSLEPLVGGSVKYTRYIREDEQVGFIEENTRRISRFTEKNTRKSSGKFTLPTFNYDKKTDERFVFHLSTTNETNHVNIPSSFFTDFLPYKRKVKKIRIFPKANALGIEFTVVIRLEERCEISYAHNEDLGGGKYEGFCIVKRDGRSGKTENLLPHDHQATMTYPYFRYFGGFVEGERVSTNSPSLIFDDSVKISIKFENNQPKWTEMANIDYTNSTTFYEGIISLSTRKKFLRASTKLKKILPNGLGCEFNEKKSVIFFGSFRNGNRENGFFYDIETGDRAFSSSSSSQHSSPRKEDMNVNKIRPNQDLWTLLIRTFGKKFNEDVTSLDGTDKPVFEEIIIKPNTFCSQFIILFCKYIEMVFDRLNERKYQQKTKTNQKRNLSTIKKEVDQFVKSLRSYLIGLVPRGGDRGAVDQLIRHQILQNCVGVIYQYYLDHYVDQEEDLKRKMRSFRTFLSSSRSSRDQEVGIVSEVMEEGHFDQIMKQYYRQQKQRRNENRGENDQQNLYDEFMKKDDRILKSIRLITSIYTKLSDKREEQKEGEAFNFPSELKLLFRRFTTVLKQTFFKERIMSLSIHPQFKSLVGDNNDLQDSDILQKILSFRIPSNEEVERTWLVKKMKRFDLLVTDVGLVQDHSKIMTLKKVLELGKFEKIKKLKCKIFQHSTVESILNHLDIAYIFLRQLLNHPLDFDEDDESEGEEEEVRKSSLKPHNTRLGDLISVEECSIYHLFAMNVLIIFTDIHDDDGANMGLFSNLKQILVNLTQQVSEGIDLALTNVGGPGQVSVKYFTESLKNEIDETFGVLSSCFNNDAYRNKTEPICESSTQLLEKIELLRRSSDRFFSRSEYSFDVEIDKECHNALLNSIRTNIQTIQKISRSIASIFRYYRTNRAVPKEFLAAIAYQFLSMKFFFKFQIKRRRTRRSSSPQKEENQRMIGLLKKGLCDFLTNNVNVLFRYFKNSYDYFSESYEKRTSLNKKSLSSYSDDPETQKLQKKLKNRYESFLRMREKVKSFSEIIDLFRNTVQNDQKNRNPDQSHQVGVNDHDMKDDEYYDSLSSPMNRILNRECTLVVKWVLRKINIQMKKLQPPPQHEEEENEGEDDDDEQEEESDEKKVKNMIRILCEIGEPETNCFEYYRIIPLLFFIKNYQKTLISFYEYIDIKDQYIKNLLFSESFMDNDAEDGQKKRTSSHGLVLFRREVEKILGNKLIQKMKEFLYSTLKWGIRSLHRLECRQVFNDFFFRSDSVISLEALNIDEKFMPKPNHLYSVSSESRSEGSLSHFIDRIQRKLPYEEPIHVLSTLSQVHSFDQKIDVLIRTERLMKQEMRRIWLGQAGEEESEGEDGEGGLGGRAPGRAGTGQIVEDHFLDVTIFMLLFSENVNHLTEFNFLKDFQDINGRYQMMLARYEIFLKVVEKLVPNEEEAVKVQLVVELRKSELTKLLREMNYRDYQQLPIGQNDNESIMSMYAEEEEELRRRFVDPNDSSVSLYWLDRLLDHVFCNLKYVVSSGENSFEIEMKGNKLYEESDGVSHLFFNPQRNLGKTFENIVDRENNPNNIMSSSPSSLFDQRLFWMEYVVRNMDRCNRILRTLGLSISKDSKDQMTLKVHFHTLFHDSRVYDIIRNEILWKKFRPYIVTKKRSISSMKDDDDSSTTTTKQSKKNDSDKLRILEKYQKFEESSPYIVSHTPDRKVEELEHQQQNEEQQEQRNDDDSDDHESEEDIGELNEDDIFTDSDDEDDDDDEEEEEEEEEDDVENDDDDDDENSELLSLRSPLWRD